jgi:ribonuclease P protein component
VVVTSLGTKRGSAHGFSKDQRVRRRAEFKHVFDRGFRLQSRHFTLLLLPNSRPGSRLGLVASKKLGDAVRRNRAKRLLREMFRQHLQCHEGPGLDAVVIPRRELLEASFATLTHDFRNLWRRGADRVAAHARG